MTAYILNKNIKMAFFNQNAILLDLKKDKFILLNEEYSNIIYEVLTKEKGNNKVLFNHCNNAHRETLNTVLDELINSDIIVQSDQDAISEVVSYNSDGVTNLEWRLPKVDVTSISMLMFLRIYYELLITHFTLKIFGIRKLIGNGRKLPPNFSASEKQTQVNFLINLASHLNKTCMFFPLRTKCLEWAITFKRLAFRMGIECQLVIGVQNFPFMSHAWVEYEKMVISDNKDLPKELAVILRVPEYL